MLWTICKSLPFLSTLLHTLRDTNNIPRGLEVGQMGDEQIHREVTWVEMRIDETGLVISPSEEKKAASLLRD